MPKRNQKPATKKLGTRSRAEESDAPSGARKSERAKPASSHASKNDAAESSAKSAAPQTPPRQFATGQELFATIASECDLAKLGVELMSGKEGKGSGGASVRARMFETSVEYLFGKPRSAPDPAGAAPSVIWDIPAPSRESV
jgi:hypothetical protein